MQMLEEMRLLPITPTPLMDDVYNEFEKSAFDILPFTQSEVTPEVIAQFNRVLETIVRRHRYADDEIALTIIEYKENLIDRKKEEGKEVDWEKEEDRIHYFLDRFFTSWIATNLIIKQHCNSITVITDRLTLIQCTTFREQSAKNSPGASLRTRT